MNREEAIKATKNGAIAACISGVVTLVVVLYAITSSATGRLAFWNDPLMFVDVVLIFACAFGMYKKSRFAAIFIFIYFIFSKIVIGVELGKFGGIGVGLVFLYFFGKAIQGAFSFHKIEKTENPNTYRSTPKWIYIAGIPIVAIFLVFMGFGLMSMTGVLPSTEVKSGTEIFQRTRTKLVSNNIINGDDNILCFYSDGFISILESGAILTTDRVILYLRDENEKIQIYELYFDDITSVELIEKGDFINDSIYQVNSYEPDAWIRLALSVENNGDVTFIETLQNKIKKSTTGYR